MKKSVELRKEYEELKNSIATLKAESKIEEAHAKLAGLKDLENKIRETEIEEMMNTEVGGKKEVKAKNKVNEIVIFNKLVLRKPLNNAEMEYLNQVGTPGQVESTDGKGGYLVPAQQFEQIKELRRTQITLKSLCTVIPVTSNHGQMPMEAGADGELTNFDELSEIAKHDIDFSQIYFKTADYGDIIPISNTLLADETANLTSFVGKRFVKKSVNTENKKILEILKTATKKTGTDYKALNTALNKELDPAISANAVIITNQSGFDWLDSLEDGNKRPLLTVDLTNPTQKLFKGRRIIVLKDTLLPDAPSKKSFYVGDVSEMIYFFDREGLELAVSTEAGFTTNATLLRAIERFDVKKVDSEAVVYVEITPAS
ncbi:capsid protein [Fusobacterium necrophorum subsp. funduliforme]|jgi:HK97 family phage major capsid protein|uniref:phage major capsid protein n=1 Tax=Fusobacterium necrophorum TaxID=859 RepID=UPI000787ECC8|nr:phage major capsid protein [Fusobacterium necrophorum]KYM38505.1 capsid protein [Fusobacterium necrophorum subsp. funduliforme]